MHLYAMSEAGRFRERAMSTLVHLRLPFFFFLLPIFLAALATSPSVDGSKALAAFIILHLLLYPASNGFNSYYDRDRGPIGGIEHPPLVDRSLLHCALALDAFALITGWLLVGAIFALGLFLYGLASKLYSWEGTRIKARPIVGWLMTGLGQGGLTYLLVVVAVNPRGLAAIDARVLENTLAVSLLLLGIFPLTQVYQHEEDAERGDLTISRLLGIRGTFALSGLCLGVGLLGLGIAIHTETGPAWSGAFALAQVPATLLFATWYLRVLRDEGAASFRATMRMNLFASGLLNAFFIAYLALERSDRFF
jgi:1,4-dihydroxy-2-naphthoate octaprenyltransferase